jgi:hypothetical protein
MIRNSDTTGDQRITSDDSEVLFVSDLMGERLVRVSPEKTEILDFGWHPAGNLLWIRGRRDVNGDNLFDERDGSELLVTPFASPGIAQPVIDAGIRATLEGWIRPPDPPPTASGRR